jgi:hypothetical protein
LNALDKLFGQFLVSPLPTGYDWLDHLDTLGAVRLSVTPGITSLKKLPVLYGEMMSGYLSAGVNGDQDTELQHRLSELRVDMPSVPHELKPGYRRLPFVSERAAKAQIDDRLSGEPEKRDQVLTIAMQAYGLAEKDPALADRLGNEIDKRSALAAVRRWWDEIPQPFDLTGVGRVLASANAKRHDHAGLLPVLQ